MKGRLKRSRTAHAASWRDNGSFVRYETERTGSKA